MVRVKPAGLELPAVLMCMVCGAGPKTWYYTLRVPPSSGVPRTVAALNVAADRFLQNAYSGMFRIVEYEFTQNQKRAH